MLPNLFNFFQQTNDIENPNPTPIKKTSQDKNNNDLIESLKQHNVIVRQNIEKCKKCKIDKNKIKILYLALTDLFTQSKFMLDQINKFKGIIDEENKSYVHEMISNISQLNNIFDSIYETSAKRC